MDCFLSIHSHYLNPCIESTLVPLDTLGTMQYVNIVYGTWTRGELFGTISFGINIQYFGWIKSVSKWRLRNGRRIFQGSIWWFENVPGSLDALGAKPSVNIVYKTMCLLKISANIYIVPIWLSTVINQIANKVKNALKQSCHMNPILFNIWQKTSHSNPGKTRQGMARHGKARPDEVSRGKTRRRPDNKVSPSFE